MQKITDIMSTDVVCLDPEASLKEVAQQMKRMDTGVIPIGSHQRVEGMVTDRDIVVKGLATMNDIQECTARDVMTTPAVFCRVEDDVEAVARKMADEQIRRIIVLDENDKLVGIVSLGDISTRGGDDQVTSDVLEQVSQPGEKRVA